MSKSHNFQELKHVIVEIFLFLNFVAGYQHGIVHAFTMMIQMLFSISYSYPHLKTITEEWNNTFPRVRDSLPRSCRWFGGAP